MEIDLKLNTKQLLRAYHLVPKHLEEELRDGMDHAGRKFLKEFYSRRLTQTGPNRIRSRGRGGIFREFKRQPLEGRGLDITQRVDTESPVAGIWERGGDRAGSGRIAVPLKFRGSQLFTGGKSPRVKKKFRDVPGLIASGKLFARRINGQTYLCLRKTGAPYFVLKNKVIVKPRLGFAITFGELGPELSKILNKSFDRALKKGGW